MSTPTKLERTSLEAHVDLCALRYEQVNKRLNNIEGKVSKLQQTVEKGHFNMIKVLIGTAGTVIVSVITMIGVLLTKVH